MSALALEKLERLRKGDVLGVAAISGPADPDALARGLAALETMGYEARLAANVGARGGALGLAGTDAERLEGYRGLLRDPAVKAVLFTRGGYGAARVLAALDPEEVRRHPKIHCGFSDLTALHAFLLRLAGQPSFHGPMVAADLARELDEATARFFPSALEGLGPTELAVPEADLLVEGSADGRLVGGCLSLLAASVGAPWEFHFDDALLLLEDLDEEAYRIDRMLGTLLHAGRLAKIRGVLIGALPGVTFGGREDRVRLRELLVERLSPLSVPVVAGLPFGHRLPNVTLPIGARAVWDGPARTLRFLEDIVA